MRREIHILSILAFSFAPHFVRCRYKATGLASASKRKPTVFSRRRTQLNSTDFFKMPQILRALPVRDVIRTYYPRFPSGLLWHLWVTRPLRQRAWTPALMLHLSNSCTEPKGSQPNLTQRHKTKSLGHYITFRQWQRTGSLRGLCAVCKLLY